MDGSPLDFLVLEDDPAVARVVLRTIRPYGVSGHVTTCDEARRRILSTPPLGLVLDWDLPDGSGYDVAEWAVKELKITRIVILSGAVDRQRLMQAHKLGVHYLLKPPPLDELERFAIQTLALQPERMIFVKVQAWRQRYELTQTQTAILNLASFGFTCAEMVERLGLEADPLRTEVRRLLSRTGDKTIGVAVARLHLETRERK